jgi:Family of unknown function (DUF6152)
VKIRAILNKLVLLAALLFPALVVPERALAHHSFEMFDVQKTVELTGTVKQWQWTNPHVWIQLNVEHDGTVTEWSLEGVSVNQLERQGWKRNMLGVGDTVSVTIHPLRNGKSGGQWLKVIGADGKQIGLVAPPPLGK